MTLPQTLSFCIVGGAVALFAWGRFRYDVVALAALCLGVAVGVVPAKHAFSGFTSDVVVIIASALVISAAIGRSGVVEQALQPLLARLTTPRTQVPALAGATALLSMVTKNVGALAIMMPVAIRVARATKTSRSSLLMPMSFLSLLGGLVTLVGTSTNIIVSQVREDTLGKPFAMFDFAPVGLALTALGFIYVSLAWRLLPMDRQGGGGDMTESLAAPYATEAKLPESWPGELATIADLKLEDDGVTATALARGANRTHAPRPKRDLKPGDVLVLEGAQESLSAVFTRTPLVHIRAGKEVEKDEAREEMRSIEAVIQSGSVLAGRSAARLHLQQEFGVNLLAVSRSGARITERLGDIRLRPGDVIVLQAGENALPGVLRALGVLPLVERTVQVGGATRRFLPITILTIAMLLVAFNIAPVAIAFFGAAVAMVATGAMSMRQAYGSLEGQVLVLIGALTPLSEAVQSTGGTAVIAGGLAAVMHGLPALITLGILMATAMACAPFLHNAPTVLVLGPVGVALASRLHLSPDPFLMAVAAGAGCDFLTPVGHQCNTLVMGPGGYRFGDYARLGLPLSILVVVIGAPLIALVWRPDNGSRRRGTRFSRPRENRNRSAAFCWPLLFVGGAAVRIRAGFKITYQCPNPTPITFLLSIRPERQRDLITPQQITVNPAIDLTEYSDPFGNVAHRLFAPAGSLTLSTDFLIHDPGLPDAICPNAVQHPIEELPHEVLQYLLGSRYCETQLLTQEAWDLFGATQPGWSRVQAIVDYVHERISFGYMFARPTRTAAEVQIEQHGVCRDFAHLAIAFCRCMNIPARYCTGYLGDIGIPPVPDPMDFSAWFEAYLGGRWHTFDARHNRPRIGRIPIAYGRDAADVAISTIFGPTTLTCFEVTTDEIFEGDYSPGLLKSA